MKNVYMMTKKKFLYPVELNNIAYHNLTKLVINNNVWMDLTHQVNTIAILNIFGLYNITCINFVLHIIYYLLFS